LNLEQPGEGHREKELWTNKSTALLGVMLIIGGTAYGKCPVIEKKCG